MIPVGSLKTLFTEKLISSVQKSKRWSFTIKAYETILLLGRVKQLKYKQREFIPTLTVSCLDLMYL